MAISKVLSHSLKYSNFQGETENLSVFRFLENNKIIGVGRDLWISSTGFVFSLERNIFLDSL